ncbi:MAG: ABC transporter permease subunit [Peptoniphilaceae bacterium]|uniref:ABC transporter permease n=1 Tax=Aedoeadaptatus acetigenes TaxID=2981723 RepID=UPI0011DDCE3D|nr:ABC transporter permease subunit [Aedoeadaptatus acetigenes]MBS6525775.1 ABC transporter permease subunit [Peptoniphilaceae bacterium]MCU6786510.1 ABC transporter permease subunit [Aedoeadaptatus acetigenes]
MKRRLPFHLAMILFALIAVAVLIYPSANMVLMSFKPTGGGGWTLANYREILTESMYTAAIKNSVGISLFSSVVAIVFTTVTTYAIVSRSKKLRETFVVIANMTSNFAGIPLAFAYIILLGSSGVLLIFGRRAGIDWLANYNLYSPWGLCIVYLYFQLPMGIILLLPIYDALDKGWRESAELLGASSFQYWRRIGLPVLMPSIVGVFAMMFANAMGAYASAEALTGTGVNLLSIRIANTVTGDIFARPEIGAALSVLLAMILLVNMILGDKLAKRAEKVSKG